MDGNGDPSWFASEIMLAFLWSYTYNSGTMNSLAKRFESSVKYLVILSTLLILFGWIMTTPMGFFEKADAIGYAVCHRIPERSFHIGNYQLPLCARCSGMYLGAMTGLIFQALYSKRRSGNPPWVVIVPLAILVIAFGVDGANSYLFLIKSTYAGALASIPNLYIPNNVLRLLTGSGMGIVISAAIFPAFNQSMWKEQNPDRAIGSIKDLILLLLITLTLDLLVLTGNPMVLYPLALFTTVGVLVLLTIVYAILWIMLFHKENQFGRLREAWVSLLAGLTIGILQIGIIDMLRYWLTGTWGEFPLG